MAKIIHLMGISEIEKIHPFHLLQLHIINIHEYKRNFLKK